MFTFAILGITVLLTIAFSLFDCLATSDEEEDERSKEEVFNKITAHVRPQCLALEQGVRGAIIRKQPSAKAAVREAAVSKKMRQYAVKFMEEASAVKCKTSFSIVL